MTSPTFRRPLPLAGLVVCIAACGGTAGSGIDLLSGDAGTGPDGAPSPSPSSSSSSSSSSGASSASSSGATTSDAGGPGNGDAGAKPGGDTTSVHCGAATCAIATDTCCVGGGTNPTFACAGAATCPRPGGGQGGQGGGETVALKCTGAANCAAGTVCCITQTGGGVSATCAPTCKGDQAQLCDPAAATTGCAAAQPCSSENIRDWRLPRTFGTCGGKGN